MDVSKILREKASKLKRTIVLPEKNDTRMLDAVGIIKRERIANIILLGKEDLEESKIKKYAKSYWSLRRHKGISEADAIKILSDPLYYAAFMVREGEVDGFVAGAANSTPDVARAAIHCLGVDSKFGIVSSAFIIQVENSNLGEDGVFFFADCAIVPDPDAVQLAKIAHCTATLAKEMFNFTPRIAMLSFATNSSAKHPQIIKVKEATRIVRELIKDGIVEGEIQADAAIVPEVAEIKNPHSKLKGRANIIIFPNLESGNISYKLAQRISNMRAIGPILQGVSFPCSDLSRGCSVEDIVDTVALTALRVRK